MTDESSRKSAVKKTGVIWYEDGTKETFELRQISDEELQHVLSEHKKWVDSFRKEGKQADLRKTDLSYRDLSNFNLFEAKFGKASLVGAKMENAYLMGANLQKADLRSASLKKAVLYGADLRKAVLHSADLQRGVLLEANLQKADLRRVNCEEADVFGVKYNRNTLCQGIRISSCHGSAMFKAFAQHQDFLEELQTRKWNNKELKFKLGKKEFDLNNWGKVLYHIWNIFADCGRTPWRWMGWSAGFMGIFAIIFLLLGKNAFVISNLSHEGIVERFGCLLYYSIVTFTTLGFGDVTPANGWAAFFVGIEVMIGYVMLGGLISIFATLITRRS